MDFYGSLEVNMRPCRSLQVFIVLCACVLMGLYRSSKVFFMLMGPYGFL